MLVVTLDAKREHADAINLPPRQQDLQPTERQQAPVAGGLDRLVEVGQRQGGANDLTCVGLLSDHRPILIEHKLEVLGVDAGLFLVQRHETPVALPGLVIDL